MLLFSLNLSVVFHLKKCLPGKTIEKNDPSQYLHQSSNLLSCFWTTQKSTSRTKIIIVEPINPSLCSESQCNL